MKYLTIFLIACAIIAKANALLDIAENVCDFGDKHLKCFMRTLQTNLNQAEAGMVSNSNLEKLDIICSDAFPYESVLRPSHFEDFERLTHLSLEYCKFKHMPSKAFFGLNKLQSLKINSHTSKWNSNVIDIDRDVFADLSNLMNLDMSFNNIWSLKLQSLCSLPNLRSLNMSKNHLLDVTDVGLGLREPSPQDCPLVLEEIDLSGNLISSLRKDDLHQTASSLKALNLADNRLTILSDDAFSGMTSLQVLNLANNQLAALPPTVFNKSSQLQELNLQNNSLTLVTPELFHGLSNLVLLNLSHNAIASHLLTSDTFGGLTSLRILDLSNNRLTSLDVELFEQLPNLEMLILDHNMLETFSGIGAADNLKHLSLANNKLSIVEDNAFFRLGSLEHLDLHGNELKELTHSSLAQQLPHLQVLLLSHNHLTSIPSPLSSELKTLDLGQNRIETIPEGIFDDLSSLYALRLAGNDIAKLSNTTFGNVSSLQVLNLASNRLEAIPQGTFVGLQHLKGLRLDDNALTDINGIVASLGRLQWLNVSFNQLEWFDYAFIPNSLEWMDMSHNDIGELGNFYNLQNFALHTLEASHNRISLLDESSLPAKRLQIVRLMHNAIAEVKPHSLVQLAYLSTLDIRHNQIRSLSKESLRKSIQAADNYGHSQVLLQGNPLACDCHLEWLPSINEANDDDNDANHVHVADLAELECTITDQQQQPHPKEEVVLVTHVPKGGFLCSYTTHCFDLCRCCDFYACDCRMQCPSGCSCQHDATWSKNVITCSNGNQTDIPLLIPMDATQIHLDGNHYGHIGQTYFLGRQRVQQMYMNHSGIQTIGSYAFTGLTALQTLDLSHNPLLRELKGQEFHGLSSLQELRLDHCGLVYVNDLTFQPLEALRSLRLDGNLLTSFPVWQLGQHAGLTSLRLAQNVWSCECQFIAPFNEFLEANLRRILDYDEIQCVSENAVPVSRDLCRTTSSANSASSGGLAKPLSKDVNSETSNHNSGLELAAILVPALLSASVLVVGILAIFVFRRHIKSWLYAKSSEVYESRYNSSIGSSLPASHHHQHIQQQNETQLFDVYISYAKADADFVDHTLAPTLEHGARTTYRLCVHHRDFPPPSADASPVQNFASIYNAVTLAADSSAKILLVLSKAYLAQEWPQVKAAILDSLNKTPAAQDKLVMLCIEDLTDVDLRSTELFPYFQSACPVIKWGSPGFINQLRFFLPESVHATFQRTVTLRSIQQQHGVYGPPEHLYHYIPEQPHVYHTLEPSKLAKAQQQLHSNSNNAKTNPTFVFKLDSPIPQTVESPSKSCHTHSLSTSSGQRLLPSPKEYIV